ncbi:MAG: class I SAM-dependent methyltransferase [Acidimicrobiales bacterium]
MRAFDVLAKRYDSLEPRNYSWAAAETVRLAEPGPADSWLDVGTGLGPPSPPAPVGRVIGVDISTAMLAQARRCPDMSRVHLVAGNARALPLRTGSIDVVTASSTLGLLGPDGPQWPEFARVLRPGGRLVASFWQPPAEPPWRWLLDAVDTASDNGGQHEEELITERLASAGLAACRRELLAFTGVFDSLDHYLRWQMCDGLGLWLVLRERAARLEFLRTAGDNLRPHFAQGPVARTFGLSVTTFRVEGSEP